MASKQRIVIFLRGVNLGATNKVPMARLRQAVSDAGADDVSTFIASGNVLCVPPGSTSAFLQTVEQLIAEEFDVRTTAVSRTPAQYGRHGLPSRSTSTTRSCARSHSWSASRPGLRSRRSPKPITAVTTRR